MAFILDILNSLFKIDALSSEVGDAMQMNNRKILLTVVVTLFSLPAMAFAGSATWSLNPSSSDWNTAANWTPATVPSMFADTATFNVSNTTNISVATVIDLDSVIFNVGASAFTITVGTGSNFLQFLQLLSITGTGITNNSGITQNFVALPNGPANGGIIGFGNSATAGHLTTFTTYGATPTAGQVGLVGFSQNASADHGTFINNGGAAYGAFGGETDFNDNATAAHGTFTNNGSTVVGAFGGYIRFGDNSSAANGVFTVNGGAVDGAFGGDINFFGASTAGNGTFTCNGGSVSGGFGGNIVFFQTSSALNGVFTINGGAVIGANRGHLTFADDSTAGSATLIANGGPGNAPDVGGVIRFRSNSSGGEARLELFGNGNMDMSPHNSDLTIGSIEGDGLIFLGANNLIVGSNKLSTTFSGVIQDGGESGGTGGSLSKILGGTLTLAGANTYSGDTFVNGGTLLVNNTTGSGTGTGAVHVNDGSTLGGAGKIAGSVTIGAPISPSAFLSPGATAHSTGTLTIRNTLTFLNGTLDFELNSDNGGADAVIANGVTLSPSSFGDVLFSITDLGSSTLTPGLEFTVIDNTASSPIAGIFTNLADGSLLTEGLNTFRANYEGGDGNNLTLEVVGKSNVPDSGTTLSLLTLAVSGIVLLRRKLLDSPEAGAIQRTTDLAAA